MFGLPKNVYSIIIDVGSSRVLAAYIKKVKGEAAELETYSKDSTLIEKDASLPSGVLFRSIRNKRSDKDQSTGKAYTYFFPHGYAEDSIVYLQMDGNDDVTISLQVRPLTGKVNYYEYLKTYDKK